MSAVDEFPVPACLDRRVLRPTPRAQSRNCDSESRFASALYTSLAGRRGCVEVRAPIEKEGGARSSVA